MGHGTRWGRGALLSSVRRRPRPQAAISIASARPWSFLRLPPGQPVLEGGPIPCCTLCWSSMQQCEGASAGVPHPALQGPAREQPAAPQAAQARALRRGRRTGAPQQRRGRGEQGVGERAAALLALAVQVQVALPLARAHGLHLRGAAPGSARAGQHGRDGAAGATLRA